MRPRSCCVAVLVAACLLGQTVAFAAGGEAGLTAPLSVRWVCSVGPDPGNTRAPVVTSDRVYLTHGGALRAIDAVTGAEVWKFPTTTARATSSAVVAGDVVLVGADDSFLYGLSAADGKEVWKQKLAGSVQGEPLLHEGVVVVGAQEMVYAVDPAKGDVKWVCSLTSPVSAGPVTDGSLLYFLCQNGSVQCVDFPGRRFRWAAPLRAGANAFPPVMAGRRVVVAAGKTLSAVTRTGGVAWQAELPAGIGGRPAVADDYLLVPTTDGIVWRLYASSGRAVRGASLQVEGAATASPLVTGSEVYAATGTGLIYALDRELGRVRWIYRCIAPDQGLGEGTTYGVYAPLSAASDQLYVLTGAGDLYCFSPSAPDPAGPAFSGMTPEQGQALSSKQPVEVSVVVTDQGSGVDPASVRMTLDGNPLTVEFDKAIGRATATVTSPKDGSHVVKVSARDYRGNEASGEWSFLTDVSIAPAETERTTPTTRQPTTRAPARTPGR